MTWIEKYRPKSFNEIKGQELVIEKLKSFIKYFGTGKKAIILHGPPGAGKTTLAYIAARETNSEIFELNASDLRNKDKLQEILKPALEQRSLIKKWKIILVDEVDGISAVDRGGLTELLSLIASSSYPIVITANDIWDSKLAPLRRNAEILQVKEINYNIIKGILFDILTKEKLFVHNDIVTGIAVRAKGDIRAAINDLQSISKLKDHSSITFDERNKETDIFNALRLIFKEKPRNEILSIFDSVDMPIDNIILWVEENIPSEYKGEELARAYEILSKVDLFKGRIYKQQYWRFLIYENILLSYGISASKKMVKPGFTSYKKPSRILKIWMNNQRTAKKKSIAQKYANHVHVGEKRVMKEFPIIKQILKNQKIREELKLSEDEIAYLDKPVDF